VTPEGIAAVEAIVKGNGRVAVNEIAAHLGVSHGSAQHIVRDKSEWNGTQWRLHAKMESLCAFCVQQITR
jgi:hypothetical protein